MVWGRRSDGGGSSSGRTPGSGPGSGGSNPPPPASFGGDLTTVVRDAVRFTRRPHRLEAQDTALSRLKHGFESRWGHHFDFVEVFRERSPSRVQRDGNP